MQHWSHSVLCPAILIVIILIYTGGTKRQRETCPRSLGKFMGETEFEPKDQRPKIYVLISVHIILIDTLPRSITSYLFLFSTFLSHPSCMEFTALHMVLPHLHPRILIALPT